MFYFVKVKNWQRSPRSFSATIKRDGTGLWDAMSRPVLLSLWVAAQHIGIITPNPLKDYESADFVSA